MNPLLVLAIGVAGSLGSALRYLADNALPARYKRAFPWGTVVINLTGSFLLGVVAGGASSWVSEPWATVASTGLLGGYTTFSTASVETVRLLYEHRWRAGLLNSLGVLVACVLLSLLGLMIGGA